MVKINEKIRRYNNEDDYDILDIILEGEIFGVVEDEDF